MSYQPYDRKEAAKEQVREQREFRRRFINGQWASVSMPAPPPLTDAELAEARRAVIEEEAEAELRRITPCRVALSGMAARSPAPPESCEEEWRKRRSR